MESFLDEYQLVRLALSLGGLVMIGVHTLLLGWHEWLFPIVVALALSSGHSALCRVRHIRAPRTMLFLDLTLWGWVMLLLGEMPVVMTASLAFLVILTVVFADGYWTGFFLVYIVGWYATSYFSAAGVDVASASALAAVVFTLAGLALVMHRVRGWLGQLDAHRSQMLGTVSHELRNNLTGMIGMTELLGSADEFSPEEVSEFVGLAHQQAVDASEIVEDLLTASRLERSALSVGVEEVDLRQEMETTVRRFVGEGAEIAIQTSGPLPRASGDALRVRQILRNLISNAVRYGGGDIDVALTSSGEFLHLVVSDDGDGVPPADEATIFLPYRRSTTGRRDPGSVGLGLWISRQLAHAMGGMLEYRRTEGITQFVLSVPVLREHSVPSGSRHASRSDLRLRESEPADGWAEALAT